jgi:predicted AlkP superfamily phosphohydrolase/phosphomutase
LSSRRILVLGLDSYEPRLGTHLMRQGLLPALQALAARSARFLLDHGDAVETGLAWEHFATGLSPGAAGKWNSVSFDPATYEAWHMDTALPPFPARLAARTVVFDVPYFHLSQAETVRGVVAWGAYDPGVASFSRPAGLLAEMRQRFGDQADRAILNAAPWPSPDHTRHLASKAVAFVDARSRVGRWLLGERLAGWDLGMMVVSELHAASEAFWYGVDRKHPLHGRADSTEAAGRGLVETYRAVDRLVGGFVAAFPDVTVISVSMNGTGPNSSDTASMVLLAELLYRHAMGAPLLRMDTRIDGPATMPMLRPDQGWGKEMRALVPAQAGAHRMVHDPDRHPLDWMPAARYAPFWPRMPAFALPSFYEGRVRINLAGREAQGIVPAERYGAVCDEIEALVRACTDSITGQPVVKRVVRSARSDPRKVDATEADLTIIWDGGVLGLDHPRHGRMGPIPYRRPGGHTGPHGMAWLAGEGLPAGDFGVRSSFDVAPTIVELLGEALVPGMSGESLLRALPA